MDSSATAGLVRGTGHSVMAGSASEAVLLAALVELEASLADFRIVLASGQPRAILAALERIEVALGQLAPSVQRADFLEDVRVKAAATKGDALDGPDQLLVARDLALSGVARIAVENEANGHLALGLARITGTRIDRLRRELMFVPAGGQGDRAPCWSANLDAEA